MAELRVKTRTKSDAFGKPKVYFCSHSRDYAKYFNEITELVFGYSDCAVFYKEANVDYSDCTHLADIAEMQLLVAPISTRLLTDGGDAVSEILFAIEKRIPILPIVTEVGLSELFNKIFPSLQYIDKTSKDPTGIPFDKKVETFLSTVLIGDELAEKIRAAFDAYVFLSYRKKDREHAQRLMSLVHKSPICRDIAIWYDEFLVPGENFNKSIERALRKSDLFLLAVTPNLVNEGNYVEEVEYPMAVKEGKPVLPVEMVPTDADSLTKKFKNIPSATPAEAELISNNLILAIERVALRKNNTPEHTYFIGLAYLSGIDVEVDFEKARELITEAADAGLYEAILRLVAMYRKGIGVKRSYESALEWENRKNAILEKRYADTCGYSEFYELFKAYIESADHERELYRFADATEKYRRAIDLAEKSGYSERIEEDLASIYIKIGDVYREEMKYSDAEKNYLTAKHISDNSSAFSSDEKRIKTLAACCDRLGDVMLAEGHSRDAIDAYQNALDSAEELLSSGDIDDKRLLSDLYASLGRAYYEEGLFEKAISAVDRASLDNYTLLSETQTEDLMRDYFNYEMMLAELYMAEGDESGASYKINGAVMSSERMREMFDDFESRRMHITAMNARCTLERSDRYRKYKKIESVIEDHNEISRESDKCFSEESLVPSVMRLVVECCVNHAQTLKMAKKWNEAVEKIDDALQIAIYMAREFPSVRTSLDLANVYLECGNIAKTYADARKAYERAIALYSELLSKTDLSGIKLSVVKAENALGVVLYKTGDKVGAKEKFLGAERISIELLLGTSSIAVMKEYVSVLSNLRITLFNEGDFDRAFNIADRAIEYASFMIAKRNTAENRRRLAAAYKGKAAMYNKLEKTELAEECLDKKKYNNELADRIENEEGVAFAASFFATIDRLIRNGNYTKTADNIKEIFIFTLDIEKELLPYRDQLSIMLEKLAWVYKLAGDGEGCERYTREAELCRLGEEGEAAVRRAWREPYAVLYERRLEATLKREYSYDYVKELVEKIIAMRESIACDADSRANKRALAEAYIRKGHILYNEANDSINQGRNAYPTLREWGYALYDVPESRECFTTANRLYEELFTERGEREDVIALAKSYDYLVSRVVSDLAVAEELSLKSFEMLNGVYQGSKNEDDLCGLADAYSSLAYFYEIMKDDHLEGAKLHECCAEIYGELCLLYGSDKYGSRYENRYSIAMDEYVKAGDIDAEMRCRTMIGKFILATVERLLEKVNDAASPDEWCELVSALWNLGDTFDSVRDKKLEYLKRALDVSLEFERRLKIEVAKVRVAHSYMKLYDLYSEIGRLEDALDCELHAIERFGELMKDEPKKNYHSYKKNSLKRVASLYERLGDAERSGEYLDMANKIKD